jgi:hypothetical protein
MNSKKEKQILIVNLGIILDYFAKYKTQKDLQKNAQEYLFVYLN